MIFQVKQREAELRGEARGIVEGEKRKAMDDARNLLKEGLAPELIARAIGIPLSDVLALKA